MERSHEVRLWPLSTGRNYIAARRDLLAGEVRLRDLREEVAAMRRSLPPGAIVPDYEFLEGPLALAIDDRQTRGLARCIAASIPYSPVWHVLDLLPHGRGDWYPSND